MENEIIFGLYSSQLNFCLRCHLIRNLHVSLIHPRLLILMVSCQKIQLLWVYLSMVL